MKKNKKILLLDNTICIDIPSDWKARKKKEDLLEITFPFGNYPVLDINVKCIDDPKINTEKKIENFLKNNLKFDTDIISITKDTYYVEYMVKTETENLHLWKVLHYLKPRSFRLINLS